MWLDETQLKNFLIDAGLISQKDSELSIESFVSSGKVSEDDMRRAKAYVLGIPFVDIKKVKIDRDILYLIPEPVARKHNIIAFARRDCGLEVAMLDPEDLAAIDFIKKSVGLKILPRLTDVGSIKNALIQYQKSLKAEFGDIVQEEALKLQSVSEASGDGASADDLK